MLSGFSVRWHEEPCSDCGGVMFVHEDGREFYSLEHRRNNRLGIYGDAQRITSDPHLPARPA